MPMRSYSGTQGAGSLTAAATTILELTAPGTIAVLFMRFSLSQQANTTSAQQGIEFARQSTAGTGVGAPVINPDDPGDAAAGTTIRSLCTTQGTIGAILWVDSFNWQNPYLWLPVPEERKNMPGAGIAGVRTLTTPPAQTINSTFSVVEIG